MTKSSTDRIEKRIELKASPARVWRALTDHREFGEWFKVNLEQPFTPGRVTRGRITHPGYEHVVMEVTVHEMRPERLFSWTWHPHAVDPGKDYSGEPVTRVEFHLEKTATGTLLTVIESGFDALPAERRDLAFRMNSEGWGAQLQNIQAHATSKP
jgi:uncharacterized protein YndB with AHSA1/START domain